MSIGTWEPPAPDAPAADTLSASTMARLVAVARAASDGDPSGHLAELVALAACARDQGPGSPVDWAAAARGLATDVLIGLIRLTARAEMSIADWKAGDRSPAIALAAELKQRGAYTRDLTAWLRAHSDNRFLPHGNLMRRL